MPWPKGKSKMTDEYADLRRRLSIALRGNTNTPVGPANHFWKGADCKPRR